MSGKHPRSSASRDGTGEVIDLDKLECVIAGRPRLDSWNQDHWNMATRAALDAAPQLIDELRALRVVYERARRYMRCTQPRGKMHAPEAMDAESELYQAFDAAEKAVGK